jgi:hypothetical protein
MRARSMHTRREAKRQGFVSSSTYAAFLTSGFLGSTLPAAAERGLSAEARLSAHRFFVAATIAALPAALSLRLRFVG